MKKFEERELEFGTKAVRKINVKGPVNPLTLPIYATSTFILDSAAHGAALANVETHMDNKGPWLYSRWGNPTAAGAASLINLLENGYGTFVTSSGMAAVTSSLFSCLRSGDHVIGPTPVYGGTNELFTSVLPNYGVEVTLVDATKSDEFDKAVRENTKVIYTESPANPTMSITDIRSVAEIARANDIVSMIDTTFASPYNQNPIDLGMDVAIHSATKYLGGHSDIIAGSITSGNEMVHKKIFQTIKLFGGTLSPFDSFLLARGIKTLDVRMQRHNENGLAIAKFLEAHPKVQNVYYPGLESHPQYDIAKSQMSGFGGMIAFEVEGGAEAGKKVIENLDIIVLAVSLGGVESLIEQAATMTHTMVSKEDREKGGITDGLLRFSVGIESVSDLKKDLTNSLALI